MLDWKPARRIAARGNQPHVNRLRDALQASPADCESDCRTPCRSRLALPQRARTIALTPLFAVSDPLSPHFSAPC
jgi:hypothetical protein